MDCPAKTVIGNFVNGSPEAKRTSDASGCYSLLLPTLRRAALKTQLRSRVAPSSSATNGNIVMLPRCYRLRSRNDSNRRSVLRYNPSCREQVCEYATISRRLHFSAKLGFLARNFEISASPAARDRPKGRSDGYFSGSSINR